MNNKRTKMDYLQVPIMQSRNTSPHDCSCQSKEQKDYYLGNKKSKILEQQKLSVSHPQNHELSQTTSNASQLFKKKVPFRKNSQIEVIKQSQPIHRRIITQILTKKVYDKTISPPNTNVISDPDEEEDYSPGYDIWGKDKDPQFDDFFDLYHYRYNQTSPKYQLSDQQIVQNIKKLFGQNLKIEGLGKYPWFTYKSKIKREQIQLQITRRSQVKNFLDFIETKYKQQEQQQIPNLKPISKIGEIEQQPQVVLQEIPKNCSRIFSSRARVYSKANASPIQQQPIKRPKLENYSANVRKVANNFFTQRIEKQKFR